MSNFQEAIKVLNNQGKLGEDAVCTVYAMDNPGNTGSALGGAVGQAIAMSAAQKYLVNYSEQGLLFFRISNSFEYSGSEFMIKHEDIASCRVGGFFSGGLIVFKLKSGAKFDYIFPTKARGNSDQKTHLTAIKADLKQRYAKK